MISQNTLYYIRDKFEAIREVWRILGVDGTATLHLDTEFKFSASPEVLASRTPRILIYSDDQLIETSEFVNRLSMVGYDLRLVYCGRNSILLMRKNTPKELPSLLLLDEVSTCRLEACDKFRHKNAPTFGVRSVYRMKHSAKRMNL